MNKEKKTVRGFDEYDLLNLKNARDIMWSVYQYNYGDPATRQVEDRLGTIIGKLDYLISIKNDP